MAEIAAAAVEFIATTGIEVAGIDIATSTLITVAATAYTAEQGRKARSRARDAYNSSLRDRYVQSRGATEPRKLVLGRQRVSGPVFFIQSWGANKGTLGFCLALAGHEIDAVEAIYFDDMPVQLDGSGAVVGITRREQFSLTGAGAAFTIQATPKAGTVTASVRYGSSTVTLGVSVAGSVVTVSGGSAGATGTVTISYQPDPCPYVPSQRATVIESVTLDGSGNGSVTLTNPPVAGSVVVSYTSGGTDVTSVNLTSFASVAGSVVTVTGSTTVGVSANVTYQVAGAPRARLRTYLGAPGQAADAALVAALPGVWTSAHKATGCAYIVGELEYDPDAFPSGVPNISAQVRGLKVLDPRTGTTAWSENPALLFRAAATHPLCGRLPTALVDDAAIAVAANACDVSSNYVVNSYAADGITVSSTQTYTRARYTAGMVVKSGTAGKNVLDDLAEAMAGRWSFVNGLLRLKAGAWVPALQTIDETWLSGASPVQVQPHVPRQDLVNLTTGKFADEQSDYQALPFPRVTSAAYVAEDGAELPQDVEFNAITFVGQAQQVAAVRLRDQRQGLRVSLSCNMRAFAVEWGDVVNITLPRFGWVAKPFEVLETNFSVDGGISIVAKETSATIFDLGATFTAFDPAPNTLLASPFDLPAVAGLSVTSVDAVQVRNADGTVVQRMRASWTPIANLNVTEAGGGVEVRYGRAGLPDSQWTSVYAERGAVQVDMAPVQQGQLYLVKARTFNSLANGVWSLPMPHVVSTRGIVVGTAQIANQAATRITPDFHDFAGAAFTESTVRTVTIVPPVDCNIEVTASLMASGLLGDSGWQAYWAVQPTAGGSVTTVASFGSASTSKQMFNAHGVYAATGGVSIDFDLVLNDVPGTSHVFNLWESSIRITEVYR